MIINLNDIIKKHTLKIKGVIHIGAHHGEELSDYLDNGIDQLILFEPIKSNYELLKQTVSSVCDRLTINSNIEIYNVALGPKETRTTMFVSSNEKQSSSILKPKQHLIHHPNVLFSTTEEVDVKTLDSFNTYGYNFINMDVQGYELEVLKGAVNTLEEIDYVYCEVNRAEVYENNAFVEQIDNFLSNYNLHRVETDWAGGIWGDALYIKI